MSSAPVSLSKKMWGGSLRVALGVYLFFVLYIFSYDQGFTLFSLAKTFAGTANILLACSFALSSMGYFFDFLDSKIAYRKYLGLLGYFSAMVYTVLLLFVRPERYFYGFLDNFWSSDILLGLTAMAILTVMALISNEMAMRWIGPQRWRMALRFGYFAFFLLVLRAILNQSTLIGADTVPEMWATYLSHPETLPPPRLLFSGVAMSVIFLRLGVEFDKWYRKPAAPLS